MALKSSREGLRKESVDYLGNLIIDENLKEKIYNSINSFVKKDLLWTNANSTSSFETQTINLDLSEYKFLIIVTRTDASNAYFINNILLKAQYIQLISYAENNIIYLREIGEVLDTGITIRQCWISGVANNDKLIPYQIYGVK